MSKASGSSERRRARLMARWRRSGESQAWFARRNRVRPRTFWGWWQADDRGVEGAAGLTTFRPVRVVDATPTAPTSEVEIVLTSGDRVYLRGEPTSRLVADVVTVLRRAC